jgi:Glycosyl-transferase for dystroglycan
MPIQYLRNIPRCFAAYRTDLVMVLDVDFVLCTDFRSRIQATRSEVMAKVKQGTAALVNPAFEFTPYEERLNQSAVPRNKRVRSRTSPCTHLKFCNSKLI